MTAPKENIFKPLLKNRTKILPEDPCISNLDALRVKDTPTRTTKMVAVASAKYNQNPERKFKERTPK
jgi:hypothetical protein